MIREGILQLSEGKSLSFDLARDIMDYIMSGKASEVQISSYLTALAIKGESIDEVTGSVQSMISHSTKLEHNLDVLEIVGTGGDKSNSFNISTTSAIVIASSGVAIAKHGNRASSSKCGSADVLEALGVDISIEPSQSKILLEEIGICFLFAQKYHSAMKYVASVRKELNIKTIFNILGPLSNPANVNMQVMGVYDEKLVEPLARVLNNLGMKRGIVVYGKDRIDEISLSDSTVVCEVDNGKFNTYEINPKDFGYEVCNKNDIVGGNPEENAKITMDILNGVKFPPRNAVCLNAGAGLYIAGKAKTLEEGIRLSEKLIDDGKALEKLNQFIEYSNKMGKE